MSFLRNVSLSVVALLAVVPAARADVQLTMQNGRVSLVATNATVRQILAEWAKVGQTKIVNGERVAGGPVTLQLTDVPEREALDVVLRSVSGYVAAPRAVPVANASHFDRIIVMPTSAAPPAQAVRGMPPAMYPQPVSPFLAQQRQAQEDAEEEQAQPGAQPFNRPGMFNPYPQPQIVNPQLGVQPAQGPLVLPQAGAPPSTTGSPASPFGGVSVPGMIAPQPQPQPPGPPRRPGGPGGPGNLDR